MKTKQRMVLLLGIMLGILLLLNGVLFYSVKCAGGFLQSKNVWGNATSIKLDDYERQQKIIANLPQDPKEALKAVDAIIGYLENEDRLERAENGERGAWILNGSEEEQVRKDARLIPGSIMLMGLDKEDMENYRQVRACIVRADNYSEYIRRISQNSRDISEILYPIGKDELALRRASACEKDYYGLEVLHPKIATDSAVKLLLNYHVTDFLAAMYCIGLAGFCYRMMRKASMEVYEGMKRILGMTAVWMVVGVIAFYLTNYLLVKSSIGMPELSIPVQSLAEYYSCTYRISVGGLLLLVFGVKLLTLVLFWLLCVGAVASAKRAITIVLLVLCFGAEFVLHVQNADFEMKRFFQEINLFSGFTAERFFNRYFRLQIGTAFLQRFPLVVLFLFGTLAVVLAVAVRRLRQWDRESQQEAMQIYFREINQRYQETRMLWHDFDNHLMAIKALYENGQGEQATKYIDDLSEQSHERLLPVKTGSELLDLIFFKKQEQATERGIRLQFDICCNLKGITVTEYDLCSLFGNILDNAMEATEPLEEKDRKIMLGIRRQNSMLLITSENPYVGELVRREGKFRTTKQDQSRHGIGLEAVRRICRKYQGSMEIHTDDNRFRLLLLLSV